MKSLIRRAFSRVMQRTAKPWAVLEIQEFETDGRVKMGIDYNDAFVEKVKSLGFQAETDDDTVQLFFVASALRPMSLAGDESVQSAEHPQLSSNQNVLMQ